MIDMEIDHIGLLVKNIEKELSIYEIMKQGDN